MSYLKTLNWLNNRWGTLTCQSSPVNPNPYFHRPICLYGTSLAISQPQPLLFPPTHITLDYDKWGDQPTSDTCRSQTPFNFHQLVHIGGQFLGSGYFHNIIQMSVRQAIAHFWFININFLIIFITEKACSHKYVVPNIQSILPANAVSIGYCGHRYIWLWWQGLIKWFDCNRCVVILQRCATLQFYQFHLDRLWEHGSVNGEWRAKKRKVLFQFSKNRESIVKLIPESGKQVCVLGHTQPHSHWSRTEMSHPDLFTDTQDISVLIQHSVLSWT